MGPYSIDDGTGLPKEIFGTPVPYGTKTIEKTFDPRTDSVNYVCLDHAGNALMSYSMEGSIMSSVYVSPPVFYPTMTTSTTSTSIPAPFAPRTPSVIDERGAHLEYLSNNFHTLVLFHPTSGDVLEIILLHKQAITSKKCQALVIPALGRGWAHSSPGSSVGSRSVKTHGDKIFSGHIKLTTLYKYDIDTFLEELGIVE